MKNRLCRMSKTLVGAICLLSTCGLTFSCSDDYDLPDTMPSAFYSSIYGYLESEGNYKNVTNLIDDLGLKDVFSKTKSMTLFAADDDAYAKFYANNSWNVRSYSELSTSQKKLLLYASMLDNPYLLEMLPNLGVKGTGVTKNVCLRQTTSSNVTDSIPNIAWDDQSFWPHTYSETETDYWADFRDQTKGLSHYIALDGTQKLMMHFINSHMAEVLMTDGDFEKVVGVKRDANDVYIYGSKVVGQDIACQNGYVHKMDRVMLAPDNMAEEIRTNGKTKLFSHLLDRFSAPYLSPSLSTSYGALIGGNPQVYEKRYISTWSKGNGLVDPNGTAITDYSLNFDPGWNEYRPSGNGSSVERDMGAMFAPNDERFVNYFLNGGGAFLMDVYADADKYAALKSQGATAVLNNNLTDLYEQVDRIPLSVIKDLINNLMQNSFLSTLPSKYLSIMNDAQDQMFSNVESVEAFNSLIDTCLLASNGAVYVINSVPAPAKYAAVSAPVLVNENTHIVNWAITADDQYITNPNSAPLNSFFSAYLLAMSSRFSLFIPIDKAMGTYIDAPSFANGSTPRVIQFSWNKTARQITTKWATYNRLTGEIGETQTFTDAMAVAVRNNRLKDLLDNSIVVHDDKTKGIEDTNDEYFITKGGSAIRVVKDGSNKSENFKVYGGWQLEFADTPERTEATPAAISEVYDQTEKTNGYGNGMTYMVDKPVQTATRSVYSIMNDNESEDGPYSEFFELCSVNDAVLDLADVAPASVYDTPAKQQAEKKKYYIFISSGGLDYNVRFFNTYRYTVYIPTNAAVKAAIANGLPTWESIQTYCVEQQALIDNGVYGTNPATGNAYTADQAEEAYKTKARAMITCLVNFLKYHFQDNSVFADKEALGSSVYETACINTATNRYLTVSVNRKGNNELSVSDNNNGTCDVTNIKNIMTRDYQFSGSNISTSSFAVVHQINGVLNFMKLNGGRYDSEWATANAAKKFIQTYKLEK